MVVAADESMPGLEIEWKSIGRGNCDVYVFHGGRRLAALLRLNGDGPLLMLNSRLLTTEARRVAVGWALGVAELGEPGWYAMVAAVG